MSDKRPNDPGAAGGDDDLSAIFEMHEIASKAEDLTKPWMKHHKFVLIKTMDQVRDLVDKALAYGRCSLDLETEGFDNRIEYSDSGEPYTVHRIVGYCISVKGEGHYIPVRHRFDATYGERDPNLPEAEVAVEIRRLCQAAQPVLTEEGLATDALSAPEAMWQQPPRVKIFFWHAKFDQEFLYPVTGIDWWHPDSFEDGMLAAYCVYTDDNNLGLKEKAKTRLAVHAKEDGRTATHPYEMIEFKELFPKGFKKNDRRFYDLYPDDGSDVVKYGCSDGICTELLCETDPSMVILENGPAKADFRNVLSECLEKHSATYRLEKQVAQAVRILERTRAKIDKAEVESVLREAVEELERYRKMICDLAKTRGFEEFNPGSPAQLSDFLFTSKGLDISPKPEKTESQQYKTDAGTLEKMAETANAPDVLTWVVKYRQIDKIIGTYLTNIVNNCDSNDKLRFNFKQTGAATGRFTAPSGDAAHGFSGIPIQGIPGKEDPNRPKVAHSLRRVFVASEGYTYVKIDYAGQELRIVANLSKEPKWVDEFLNAMKEGREADLHTLTAQAFFPGLQRTDPDFKLKRSYGKVANFALVYGGGTGAVQRATKCDKVEAARRKANFDKSVPVFAGWVKIQHAKVKKLKGVYNAFGRFIAIPDADIKAGQELGGRPVTWQDAKKIQAACERKATNFPIQSSGADVLKISLVKLVKELTKRGWLKNGGDDSVRMLMTVHDEIVFEIKHERLQEALPIICEIMESPSRMVKWKIPLVVEPLIGKSWDAKYDWNKIMKGEEPVPEWLVQHVQLGVAPQTQAAVEPMHSSPAPETPPPSLEATLKPQEPPSEAVSEESPAPPPSVTLPPPKSPPLAPGEQVATFVAHSATLYEDTLDKAMIAITTAISRSKVFYRLRIVDESGNVLIDPAWGIRVDPDALLGEFRYCSFAMHEYELGPLA